jgi:hypothetical protein
MGKKTRGNESVEKETKHRRRKKAEREELRNSGKTKHEEK